MIRDILVHTNNTPPDQERLNYAAGLAAAHQAHLTALHIRHPPFIPADVMGTGVAEMVIQVQRSAQEERAKETRRMVDATADRLGQAIEWRDVEGDIDDLLTAHGYYSDLLVIGQRAPGLVLEPPFSPDPAKAIVTAGRPVIVVPTSRKVTAFGKRILIAWKASSPAARAVSDAMPLLQKAEEVTVMEVTEDAATRRIAGADIASHLARHGVKLTVEPFIASAADAFPLIQARALDLGADLIVMGGYGYSRLWEAALGGVTRQMLQEQFIPVFFSH
jgi:nucleotide-binding universal stress UspA family protein